MASFLARNLANLCFGHEPKARVATLTFIREGTKKTFIQKIVDLI